MKAKEDYEGFVEELAYRDENVLPLSESDLNDMAKRYGLPEPNSAEWIAHGYETIIY